MEDEDENNVKNQKVVITRSLGLSLFPDDQKLLLKLEKQRMTGRMLRIDRYLVPTVMELIRWYSGRKAVKPEECHIVDVGAED